jgi:hypothetical protein
VIRAAVALAVLAGCGGAAHPAPPRCPTGDVVLASQASVDGLAGCARIDGDLRIRTGAPLGLAPLASLTQVTGALVIGPTLGLDVIDGLSALREVGALRLVANGDATGAYFPALVRAGAVEVDGNLALTQLMVPALRDVARDLTVRSNAALELVDLSAAERVGGTLSIEKNPLLSAVWTGALRSNAVHVLGNPRLDAEAQARLIATAAAAP